MEPDYFIAILGPLKIISLLSVIVAFTGVVVFALWPSKKKSFDEAARLPLNED
ncbi:cbb3-type cytochrome oxidase subunit 3 [Rhodoblastus sp.]|jgi:cytochrome c oxidase cbb3-type subunit IV|uniref:cbb3-type cytochrome oxidase subunit 3 n=1 Tax=Rhodoblastus sp. TaxID=1962975 RepID=UPI003F9C49A9